MHSPEEIHRMIFDDEHASHRCHNPTCVNPDHICVETKAKNEERKGCRHKVRTFRSAAILCLAQPTHLGSLTACRSCWSTSQILRLRSFTSRPCLRFKVGHSKSFTTTAHSDISPNMHIVGLCGVGEHTNEVGVSASDPVFDGYYRATTVAKLGHRALLLY